MSKQIKGRKIRNNVDEVKIKKYRNSKIRKISDRKMEQEAEIEESISIGFLILIILVCFIVGIVLGFSLYKLAIDNSNVALIMNKLFK